MVKVTRVDLLVLGPRNSPVVQTRLPEAAVADLPGLVEAAQRLNPSVSYEEVIRSIWRHGTKVTRDALARGAGVRVEDLPKHVKPIPKK